MACMTSSQSAFNFSILCLRTDLCVKDDDVEDDDDEDGDDDDDDDEDEDDSLAFFADGSWLSSLLEADDDS